MSAAWKAVPERSNVFWLRLLIGIGLLLGRHLARLLLLPTVIYFLVSGARARRHSRAYLQRVLATKVGWRQIARHYYCFAAASFDRLYLAAGRDSDFEFQARGAELFDPLVRDKRGAVLIISHVGSFEVLRLAARQREQRMRLRVLMNLQHSRMLNAVLRRLNPGFAADIIDTGLEPSTLALRVRDALDQGHMVGIMADRLDHPAERAASAQFLGSPARFPATPWLLAAVLQVPVIFCLGLYLPGGRYALHFEQLGDGASVSRPQRAAHVQQMVERYAGLLEKYLRQQPYNWFNFYDYWAAPAAATAASPSRGSGPSDA